MTAELKNTRILVLGGTGFMGKNLQHAFSGSEYTVSYVSRATGCNMTYLPDVVHTLSLYTPDIIINAAAHVGSINYVTTYAADVMRDNTAMYLCLYEGVKIINPNIKIINPISNCSYPGNIDIQNEEDWWLGPIHPSVESYGMPKKVGYILSKCYEKQYGVKTTNLIIPNSYGPNDYLDSQRTHAMNGIIMRMLQAKANGDTEFVVWGTGIPIREWIYMPDVARIIKHIVDNNLLTALPNPINLGQQYGVSINETVEIIRECLEYEVTVKHDTTKQDGAPIKVLGNKLFNQYFPDFKFTDYKDGIQETIKYYKEQLNL